MQRWDSEHAASSSRRARALIRGGVGGGDRGGGGGVGGGGRHDAPPLCVLRREPVRRVPTRHVRGMSGGAWQTCPALLRPGPRRRELPVQWEAAASGRRAVVEAYRNTQCAGLGRAGSATERAPQSRRRPSFSIFADITLKGTRGAAATACAPICVAISALSSASSSSRLVSRRRGFRCGRRGRARGGGEEGRRAEGHEMRGRHGARDGERLWLACV